LLQRHAGSIESFINFRRKRADAPDGESENDGSRKITADKGELMFKCHFIVRPVSALRAAMAFLGRRAGKPPKAGNVIDIRKNTSISGVDGPAEAGSSSSTARNLISPMAKRTASIARQGRNQDVGRRPRQAFLQGKGAAGMAQAFAAANS
jgi:hypothetical protein